jgi:hypothetical protein
MLFLVFGTRSDSLRDQRIHVGRTLGGAVKHKMQRGHRVDVQALEQAVAQETRRLVQRRLGPPGRPPAG